MLVAAFSATAGFEPEDSPREATSKRPAPTTTPTTAPAAFLMLLRMLAMLRMVVAVEGGEW